MPKGRDNRSPESSIMSSIKSSTKSSTKAKVRYNPDLPEAVCQDPGKGKVWRCFCWFMTCLIPGFMICRPDKQGKKAWREKVVIFEIFLLFNLVFLFFFGAIPFYFCRYEDNFLSDYGWYQTIIDETCIGTGYASYGLIFIVAGLLGLQCICSMIVGIKSFCFRVGDKLPFHPKKFKNPIMIMVPCYNEGDKELGKTIASVLESDYSAENRVLFVVADGIITGKGEYLSTPATLAKILGFSLNSSEDKAYAYKSLGGGGANRASVYSGIHEKNGKFLKFVVVIKRGTAAEKDSSKPGNRGKRDSQLIALGLLNRLHHGRRLVELDKALCDAFDNLGVPVSTLQYMLAIDADTRISVGAISHMAYNMNKSPKVLACCGETRVDNKFASWVTYIQIYEYFASHHLKKSFESIFGVVTCLPGCFTMYRISADDQRALIASDAIFQSYARNDIESLHEKNLYQLGEDRMLTTLLLKYFADMSLSFVPIACCWTMVPDTFKVLLSQRRRWINSTFHNMWQLMKIRIQCGFCCVSMNAIVILDLVFYMILPSGLIYAILYTYTVIADDESINIVTISLYIALIGFQMIIFLVRSRVDFIIWFLIYLILGIPVFYFILPIYSFWNMDDFSWGTTREVAGGKNVKTAGAKGASGTAPPPSNEDDVAGYGAGDMMQEEMDEEETNSSISDHSPFRHGDLAASKTRPERSSTKSSGSHPVDIDALSNDIETAIPTEVHADVFGNDFSTERREAVFDEIYGDLPTSNEHESRGAPPAAAIGRSNKAVRKSGSGNNSSLGSSRGGNSRGSSSNRRSTRESSSSQSRLDPLAPVAI